MRVVYVNDLPEIPVDIFVHDVTNERGTEFVPKAREIANNFNPETATREDWIALNWASQFIEIREEYPELMNMLKKYYE